MSRSLLLPDEDAGEWRELLDQLIRELMPVGTLEQILVERIAVAVWRQRRLIRVETARIQIAQRPGISERHGVERWIGAEDPKLVQEILSGTGQKLRDRLLEEFLAIQAIDGADLVVMQEQFPFIWQYLQKQAASYGSVDGFLQKFFKGKLDAYLSHMITRQALIVNAYEQVKNDKAANSLPAAPELISRYQSALDNDLYKAIRALREAQRFRWETLEATSVDVSSSDI